MFKKMIICVLLLAISTAQAFPSTNVEPDKKQLDCAEKRGWYEDVMNNTKNMYDAYNTKINEAKLPSDIFDKLKIEHEKFENNISEILKLYRTDSDKGGSNSDSAEKLSFCMTNIQKYRELNVNLTASAVNLKTNVLNVLEHSTVSKEVKDNLGKMLSQIVNFLYVTDMTENLYKDVNSFVAEASNQTEKGNALEKKYEFDKDGKLIINKKELEEEYKDILADNEEDKKLQDDLDKLEDDSEIRAAEERAKVAEKGDDEKGFISLGLGFGIATLAVILLSILVGSVLVWIRSQSYSRFS